MKKLAVPLSIIAFAAVLILSGFTLMICSAPSSTEKALVASVDRAQAAVERFSSAASQVAAQ